MKLHPWISKKREKSQSLMELAISLLFLLILLAGIADVGRMLFYYLSMRDAVQEGASYASVYPKHCDQIVDRVQRAMNDRSVQVLINIDGASCYAASEATQACSGKAVTIVAIQPNFELATPLIGTFLGGESLNLKTQITGTILRPPCQ